MSLKPSQWKPSDSRQRAPFAHTSSSADLTSVDIVSPLRAFQPLPPTRYADDVAFQESIRPRTPAPNPFRLPQLSIPGYDTLRFISLCTLWYASSALSSNTGKVILNRFRFPVTLTIVQFFFVAFYCILCSWLGWTTLKKPSRAIFHGVLPMAAFQVGGHIFGSLAISRVPVSTVHTIKVSDLIMQQLMTGLISALYCPDLRGLVRRLLLLRDLFIPAPPHPRCHACLLI